MPGQLPRIRYITIPNHHFRFFLDHFLGVEEMVADERRVHVISIPLALLEWAVEVSIHASFVGFLVDVDSSEGRTLAEVGVMVGVIQTGGANCSLHL